ncbi:MAG: Arabinose 5-phosphate isomerase KdsD [Syntrophorhabdaceae bacterium PtaU1.Bin034]|jgi:arabinose-5-phosphate isomerase|nr:MAG: Arabinose 5-phosphate isomerase KdsD [Syntrophorhabdaceae bacterium PtaU1.Bin034]
MGKEVLEKEARAILQVMEGLNEDFDRAVNAINCCKGRVIFSGIGKSGLIAKKIASTFSSIGVPSVYLHPADSLHGDLGIIQRDDIFFVISNSGETDEVIKVLPWIKRMGMVMVVVTGNRSSTIAGYGDIVLDVKVEEACPYNLIPTSSTTTTLALGDAIAVTLMKERNFTRDDLALLHPGGSIGRSLLMTVADLMHTGNAIPIVYEDMLMKHVIIEVTSKRLGVTGVFNRDEEMVGIITDGDLRRALEKHDNMLNKRARDVMTASPKGIEKDALAAYALKEMEEFSITSLFVFEREDKKRPVGIIHIHDLLKAKIV